MDHGAPRRCTYRRSPPRLLARPEGWERPLPVLGTAQHQLSGIGPQPAHELRSLLTSLFLFLLFGDAFALDIVEEAKRDGGAGRLQRHRCAFEFGRTLDGNVSDVHDPRHSADLIEECSDLMEAAAHEDVDWDDGVKVFVLLRALPEL